MTEPNLVQKILEWLNTQGFATEMRVAKHLSSLRFDILKSSYYDDPETGISREIDVIGRLTDSIGLLSVYAVIECKKSSKPWVVFSSDRSGFNRIQSFAIMTPNASKVVLQNLSKMQKIEWFRKRGRIGYGIATAFDSREDETFKAGMSATKAAISIAKKETTLPDGDLHHFLFPTVVLDGQLFECYLGEDGNPIVAEIDSAPLLFPVRIGGYHGAAIQIVTASSFGHYCVELSSTYGALKDVLQLED
jgi:hypothetical protein